MSAQEYLTSVAIILSVMAAVALLEVAVPLFARPATLTGRRRANLAMTIQALLFAYLLTSTVAVAALLLPLASPGLMAAAGLPAAPRFLLGIVALELLGPALCVEREEPCPEAGQLLGRQIAHGALELVDCAHAATATGHSSRLATRPESKGDIAKPASC